MSQYKLSYSSHVMSTIASAGTGSTVFLMALGTAVGWERVMPAWGFFLAMVILTSISTWWLLRMLPQSRVRAAIFEGFKTSRTVTTSTIFEKVPKVHPRDVVAAIDDLVMRGLILQRIYVDFEDQIPVGRYESILSVPLRVKNPTTGEFQTVLIENIRVVYIQAYMQECVTPR